MRAARRAEIWDGLPMPPEKGVRNFLPRARLIRAAAPGELLSTTWRWNRGELSTPIGIVRSFLVLLTPAASLRTGWNFLISCGPAEILENNCIEREFL